MRISTIFGIIILLAAFIAFGIVIFVEMPQLFIKV